MFICIYIYTSLGAHEERKEIGTRYGEGSVYGCSVHDAVQV